MPTRRCALRREHRRCWVIALGAAVDYVSNIGMEAIRSHEQDILSYAHQRLSAVEGLADRHCTGNPVLYHHGLRAST